jgi:cell division protein ZapE
MTAVSSPLSAYEALVRAGRLEGDPVQRAAAFRLDRLADELRAYRPSRASFWRRWLRPERGAAPRGLYLHGDVGRGKTMLMDLFFEMAPVAKKRRVHFHAFMLEVHDRINEWRRAHRANGAESPLPPLARRLAAEARLLCLDEFQVTNIADAMILARLFAALFDHGVVVVATSNTAPDDLYAGGLQREIFLPFIDILKANADVLSLDGDVDYRLHRLDGMPVYHTPLTAAARAALEATFVALTDGARGEPVAVEVKGRRFEIPRFAKGVAFLTFADLCEKPLGAADYAALATHARTVLISDIPRLGPEKRNEVARFVTLIDTLYDRHVRLICSAEAPPAELYMEGDGSEAFRRAASRLVEMQSTAYIHGKQTRDASATMGRIGAETGEKVSFRA